MDHKSCERLWARWEDVSQLPTTSAQRTIISVLIVLTALSAIMYLLRILCRIKHKQVGIDDYLLGLATAFAVADMGVSYMYFKYAFVGFPPDSTERMHSDPVPASYWSFVMQVLYNPVLALVKASVLVLLLRIGGHRARVRWTIYVLQVLNLVLMLVIFFLVIFQRIPLRAYWDPSVTATYAIDSGVFIVASAGATIVGDVLVLAIPVWLFVGLRVRLATKLGLIFVFLLSGLVTCIGVLRLVFMHRSFTDPGYDHVEGWGTGLSQIESCTAILSACVPALRPLLAGLAPGWFPTGGPGAGPGRCPDGTATIGGTHGRSGPGPGPGPGPGSKGDGDGDGDDDEDDDDDGLRLEQVGRARGDGDARGHSPSGSEEEMIRYA